MTPDQRQPPVSELDSETRARIRAEELERARVRDEIAAEKRQQNRPGYWTGVFLNLLVSGGGLMYLGRTGEGLAWLAGALLAAFMLTPFIGWIVGVLGSLWRYDVVYGELYATAADKAEDARQDKLTIRLVAFIVILLLVLFIINGGKL